MMKLFKSKIFTYTQFEQTLRFESFGDIEPSTFKASILYKHILCLHGAPTTEPLKSQLRLFEC